MSEPDTAFRVRWRVIGTAAVVLGMGAAWLVLAGLAHLAFAPHETTSLADYDDIVSATHDPGTPLAHFPVAGTQFPPGSLLYAYGGVLQEPSYMALYIPSAGPFVSSGPPAPKRTLSNNMLALAPQMLSILGVSMVIDPPDAEWYVSQHQDAALGSFGYVIVNTRTGDRLHVAYFD